MSGDGNSTKGKIYHFNEAWFCQKTSQFVLRLLIGGYKLEGDSSAFQQKQENAMLF